MWDLKRNDTNELTRQKETHRLTCCLLIQVIGDWWYPKSMRKRWGYHWDISFKTWVEIKVG